MLQKIKTRKSMLIIPLVLIAIGTLTWAMAQSTRPRSQDRFDADSRLQARARAMTHLLAQGFSADELTNGVYIGSEFCLACHAPHDTEVGEWRDTKHAFFIRQPMGAYTLQPGKGVMANSLGLTTDDFMAGLDFNSKTGTPFDSLKPNAPILSYDKGADKYYVQLGPSGLKMAVVATLAGQSVGNGQRYMVRVPVSDSTSGSAGIYFAPVVWGGAGWTSNASSWYTGNAPKYYPGMSSSFLAGLQSQNYLQNCSGCHITGVKKAYKTTAGEGVVIPYPAILVPDGSPNYPDLDGNGVPDMANIGCESCHGPGSKHILGAGDPAKIVNPKDIANNQQRSITCLQCHVQIASAPSKTWGFTYNETANQPFVMTNPPASLDAYQVFTGGKWPDGWNYVGARLDSFRSSDHYQGAHGIACNDCHNPHAETTNDAQVRDKITHGPVADIPANVDNDSFCLSCHATHGIFSTVTYQMVKDWDNNLSTIIPVIEKHTNHPYAADRIMGVSRCTTCHMAPTAGHGTIEGVSHTFMPARPEDTIAMATKTGTGNTWGSSGNVNSCSASCHRGRVIVWTNVPANATPNDVKFNTPNELSLANYLVKYFGPGGSWWDTKK